ncbi:NADPH-dependent FMN reductase [Demequina sp.]|uniref:NADPH-dependent FMN reductase n=1 Tax=Demequina sp. TaxID=2050685 RepID=UPI0025C6F8B7|nr:NADPH-dependent FMN reductase [Demequina sp.]
MRLGYIVGSLSSTSINRKVADALVALAPEGVELVELDYSQLPVYSPDVDGDYPQAALDWKSAIEGVDGIVIVTPEYLRSVPGALKNAIDWASRPWGTNSFNGTPVAIAGASIGAIGTAAAQQHLRAILAHLNAPTLGQPEVFLQYRAGAWDAEGALIDEQVTAVLQGFLAATVAHVERYATVAA